MGEDLLSSVNPAVVTPLGALVAVLVFLVRAVATGQLVPRKTYEDLLADRDRWRQVVDLGGQTLQQMSRQIDGLVAASATTVELARALQDEHKEQQQDRAS